MRKFTLNDLRKPSIGLAVAPVIFAFSQLVILGYYWIFGGYFGDLTLTISRYVGLQLWSSILFAVCNILIIVLLLRYFWSVRKVFSPIWFLLSLIEVVGFIGLSIFPHVNFVPPETKEVFVNIHIGFARTMFVAMFLMGLERLRIARLKDDVATKATIAFLIYGIIYITGYSAKWNIMWGTMLIWETGYIYAFMAMLILTRRNRRIEKRVNEPIDSAI